MCHAYKRDTTEVIGPPSQESIRTLAKMNDEKLGILEVDNINEIDMKEKVTNISERTRKPLETNFGTEISSKE